MRNIRYSIYALAAALSSVLIINIGSVSALAAPALFGSVSASKDAACAGLSEVDSSQTCSTSTDGINGIVKAVVNIISFVAGTVAVVMVVISGFRYITSSGDANKVGAAKTTLIYALVGIAVVVLAQVLVHLVVNTSVNATDGLCKDGVKGHEHIQATDPHCN